MDEAERFSHKRVANFLRDWMAQQSQLDVVAGGRDDGDSGLADGEASAVLLDQIGT